jgi:hypothetical protein
MTREQTIEAIRVMQAFVDGKGVEYEHPNGIWMLTPTPCWNWSSGEYRIKPTPVLRPWTPDEVPLGAWGRNPQYPKTRWLIDRTSSEETRKDWLDTKYEHSTDLGKTWLPCGVVEESK